MSAVPQGTSFDDPDGSKLAAAARAQAQAQGADVAPHEVPNFDVQLHFVYRGSREEAERLRDDFLFALLQMPAVQRPIDNSVSDRVIGPPE